MTLLRGVAVVAGTTLLAIWLVSVVSTGAPAPRSDRKPPESVQVDPPFRFDAQVARLRAQAGQQMARPDRNPFTFGRDGAPGEPEASSPRRAGLASDQTDSYRTNDEARANEPLSLIGIAERRTDDGTERVAIVSGGGELFLAAVGQRVGLEYVVEAIADDAVELAGEGGRRLHLVLR
jgi:hypothetical protein